MSYLEPPPLPTPVVVMKDVGGLVTDYQARTELYRAQNREVRLHECRSACTLALSLPNVCVYPDSMLKFHQAYNEITKEADEGVSNELWQSYPAAVRARLGKLTRAYKVIRGSELISLGVRDCTAPQRENIMIARARPAPQPENASGLMLAKIEGTLSSFLGTAPKPAERAAPRLAKAAPAASAPAPDAPKIGDAAFAPSTTSGAIDIPLPPRRPPMIAQAPQIPARISPQAPPQVPAFLRPVPGSQPILPAHFVTLASLR